MQIFRDRHSIRREYDKFQVIRRRGNRMRDATWYVFLDLVLRIVTAVTIPIAVWSLRTTWRTHLERSTFEMDDRMYSLCHILQDHVQRDWRGAHLHFIRKIHYLRKAPTQKKRSQ